MALLEQAVNAAGTKHERDELRIALADTHIWWATGLRKVYENAAAIEHYKTAYEIDKELRRKVAAADLDSIGRMYSDLGENQKALDCYKQALTMRQVVGDHGGEALTLSNIGAVYSDLGEKRQALKYYEQALPIQRAVADREGEARTLNRFGVAYGSLGQNQKALEYYEQALAIQRPKGDREGEALTLSNIGAVYSDLGEKRKALKYYEQALPIQRAVGDRRNEAWTLRGIGGLYSDLGEKQEALKFYEQALPIQRTVGDSEGEAATLAGIGAVYADLGEKRKGLQYYEQALPIQRAGGYRWAEAMTLSNIGAAYSALGEKRKALEHYEQALPIQRAVGDRWGEVRTLNGIGGVYSDRGEKRKALEYYEQALPISRAVGDRRAEAMTLSNIGGVYSGLGEQRKALEYYEQALPISRVVGDRWGEGVALRGIGGLYSALGEKRKALEYYEQALPISRVVGDRWGEGVALNDIGRLYFGLGEVQKALEYYEQALPIRRAVDDRQGEAATLISIGSVYGDLGAWQKALEYYGRGLLIQRAVVDRSGEALTLFGIGAVCFGRGEDRNALEYLKQALPIQQEIGDRPGEAVTLSGIGTVYSRLGEKHKAVEYFERALPIHRAVGDREREAVTLSNIGTAYWDLGEKRKTLAYHEQALPISRAVGDRRGEAAIAANLMLVWNAFSRPRLAVFYGKEAVNLRQQLRANIQSLDNELQRTYLKTIEGEYRILADILISQGRLPEAQQVLSLLKEEEYFEFVRREAREASSLDARATLTPAEAEWQRRYAAIADRVAGLGRKRGELEGKKARTAEEDAELARLDSDLEVAGKAFQAFLDQLAREFGKTGPGKERVFQVREAQGLMEDLRELGEGTVALYTLVGEKNTRIILITPDVQKAAEYQINAADLARKVFAFREALQDPDRDPRPIAQELYHIVVGPIANDLAQAGARTLMWSLDGVLRYMPIAALYDGEKYLVERYRNVIFTPASNARLKDRPSAAWRGVGLGVSHAHEGFLPLPGVPAELHGIFGDSQGTAGVLHGTILLDDAFTATAMKAAIRGREPVVHVASHFRFSPGNETASFLLLGDGGRFTLDQVRSSSNLFRGVDLLTLSACETAMGGESNGREVEGFAVLAQRQGAKAVIATLWPVVDASTSLLMQELYRVREETPGTPKVEALRQAQLALLYGRVKLTGKEAAARNAEILDPKKGSAMTAASPSSFRVDPRAPYAHPYFWAPFILIGNFR